MKSESPNKNHAAPNSPKSESYLDDDNDRKQLTFLEPALQVEKDDKSTMTDSFTIADTSPDLTLTSSSTEFKNKESTENLLDDNLITKNEAKEHP